MFLTKKNSEEAYCKKLSSLPYGKNDWSKTSWHLHGTDGVLILKCNV